MNLLALPECPPLPHVVAWERDGWTFHAASHSPDRYTGIALLSRAGRWALGAWGGPFRLVSPMADERAARAEFDRRQPKGNPRVGHGGAS